MMHDNCGRFYFAKDMNGDGVFSISDIWLIIHDAWLLPSKATIVLLQQSEDLARFFELSCNTGESWGGGIYSFICWVFVLVLVAVMNQG